MRKLEILLKTGLTGAEYATLSRALSQKSETTKCPQCNNILEYVCRVEFNCTCGTVEMVNGEVRWNTTKDSNYRCRCVVADTEHNEHFRCSNCDFVFNKNTIKPL